MAQTKIIEYLGTGRRKTAVARVRLASGKGKIPSMAARLKTILRWKRSAPR